ncbi:hypothetical protein [Mesorhizobium sp. CAU 1741]|uniref:hypothetical protein n=1 Tax=Mesorhizobium sp. CAU 1741 TaxID=3140366 RepID=UPI00325A77D3
MSLLNRSGSVWEKRPALAGDTLAPSGGLEGGTVPAGLEDLIASADEDQILMRLFGDGAEMPTPAQKPSAKPASTPAPRRAKSPLLPAPPPTPKQSFEPFSVPKKRFDRGDVTIAALGITLGLICAAFPWYIFFNQEKFGVKEFVFDGGRAGAPPAHLAYQPKLVAKPFANDSLPSMNLDFFPTATLPQEGEEADAIPVSEQPFPLDLVSFRLVHVANGRAMIEDADGLWVVQPGSRLPDASEVVSIEQRDGGWVLVTSRDTVIELQR